MLLNMVIKYGRLRTVTIIAFINVVISEIITYSIFYFLGQPIPVIIMYLAVIIPGALSSLGSWHSVGMILKIHKLEQEVRKLANYDSLTSVMSRTAFLNTAETIYQLMQRNQSPFAFLYIDIDDFKKINDTFTHAGGDTVLQGFGSILLSRIRKSDIVGRLGGEEFAILLADTNLKGAIHFAGKIQNSIKNATTNYHGRNIPYTISIGVSVFNQDNKTTLDRLIAQADTALYAAKNSGKNCVMS